MKSSKENPPTKHLDIKSKGNVEMVPPDGGWGWMIFLGSFIIMTVGPMPTYAFSYLFSPILMTDGVSSTKIAWIYNTQKLSYSIFILFVAPLCAEFGHRKIGVFGSLTVFVSMILSAFAPSVDFLFFSYGLLGGIGGSCILSICILIISKYFKKRRGFVIGITHIGSSLCSFIAPLMVNYFIENYNYVGATLILAAIVLNQCVGAMLFQPVEWHMKQLKSDHTTEKLLTEESIKISENKASVEAIPLKNVTKEDVSSSYSNEQESQSISQKQVLQTNVKEDKRDMMNNPKSSKLTGLFFRVLKSVYKNLKLFKFLRVQFIVWAGFFLMLGFSNFLIWIPFIITDVGYPLETAAWCSALTSIGTIGAKLVLSVVSDRKFFNERYAYMLGSILVGSSILGFSLVMDIKGYIIFGCLWGFGMGLSLTLTAQVIIDVLGVEMLPALVGISQLFHGLAGIIAGTLLGALRDATKSYKSILWIISGCAYLGFFMFLLMPLAEKFDKKKYLNKDEKKESPTTHHST